MYCGDTRMPLYGGVRLQAAVIGTLS